jgi:pimeloyl-ACP methyl ester carboxylesterase
MSTGMSTATSPGVVAPEGLFELLDARLRTTPPGPLLDRRSATVVFDPVTEPAASVELRPGRRPRARRVRAPRPTTLVRGRASVLHEVLAGERSGLEAFLAGELSVRGDLSLALGLHDLVHPAPDRPVHWPRMDMVSAGGVRTAVVRAGEPTAPAVVLLHGLGATSASMITLLSALAEDHHVLAPDLPGFGASAAPRSSYQVGWFVDWLVALLDAEGVGSAVLVGNSMGGRLAIEAGLLRPDRVAGLVLLCPSTAVDRARKWVPLARLARPEVAALPWLVSRTAVLAGLRRVFAHPELVPQAWYDVAADEFLRAMRSASGRVAFVSCLRQLYLEDGFGGGGFWTRLADLVPPALFIWGDRDRLVPAANSAYVTDALPGAQSVVLTDCGHVPQFEQPEMTVGLLRDFLGRVERRSE